MRVVFDTKEINRKLLNIAEYSIGFLDGTQAGKKVFLDKFANEVIGVLKKYIDVEARMNPQSLHHVYEWYKTGSPAARLFEFSYDVNLRGIKITSEFSQSQSLSHTSNEPFYNKAAIMEQGKRIVIRPKDSDVLAFENGSETVFTKKEIIVDNPGGLDVEESFKNIIDEFFNFYFKQSFLRSSGLEDYLSFPQEYKTNFNGGAKRGKIAGYEAGLKWIAGAPIGAIND